MQAKQLNQTAASATKVIAESARLIQSHKHLLEIWVLIITYSNGKSDVLTYHSEEGARAMLRAKAPNLSQGNLKVERV